MLASGCRDDRLFSGSRDLTVRVWVDTEPAKAHGSPVCCHVLAVSGIPRQLAMSDDSVFAVLDGGVVLKWLM